MFWKCISSWADQFYFRLFDVACLFFVQLNFILSIFMRECGILAATVSDTRQRMFIWLRNHLFLNLITFFLELLKWFIWIFEIIFKLTHFFLSLFLNSTIVAMWKLWVIADNEAVACGRIQISQRIWFSQIKWTCIHLNFFSIFLKYYRDYIHLTFVRRKVIKYAWKTR